MRNKYVSLNCDIETNYNESSEFQTTDVHKNLSYSIKKDCGELIKDLQECHAKGFFHKYMGGCNTIKQDLNACLREEVCQFFLFSHYFDPKIDHTFFPIAENNTYSKE